MKRIPATATALLLALAAAPLPLPARAAGTVLEGLNYPWDIEAQRISFGWKRIPRPACAAIRSRAR